MVDFDMEAVRERGVPYRTQYVSKEIVIFFTFLALDGEPACVVRTYVRPFRWRRNIQVRIRIRKHKAGEGSPIDQEKRLREWTSTEATRW